MPMSTSSSTTSDSSSSSSFADLLPPSGPGKSRIIVQKTRRVVPHSGELIAASAPALFPILQMHSSVRRKTARGQCASSARTFLPASHQHMRILYGAPGTVGTVLLPQLRHSPGPPTVANANIAMANLLPPPPSMCRLTQRLRPVAALGFRRR